jgi:hypothetical protein
MEERTADGCCTRLCRPGDCFGDVQCLLWVSCGREQLRGLISGSPQVEATVGTARTTTFLAVTHCEVYALTWQNLEKYSAIQTSVACLVPAGVWRGCGVHGRCRPFDVTLPGMFAWWMHMRVKGEWPRAGLPASTSSNNQPGADSSASYAAWLLLPKKASATFMAPTWSKPQSASVGCWNMAGVHRSLLLPSSRWAFYLEAVGY